MIEKQNIFENKNNEKPKRIKGQYLSTPIGPTTDVHIFEIEYEEISPGVWQKVFGTEKDLGPLQRNSGARFKGENKG